MKGVEHLNRHQNTMFRKIVTESTYSPAIAVSLSDYIRLLKRQTSKRQIGLIFVLLAVVVQLFVAAFPSESANASNPEVFIDGGIQSVEEYLRYYDQNSEGIKDLLDSLGITRLDIETSIPTALQSTDGTSVWSMHNVPANDNLAYLFTTSDNQKIAYHRPLQPQDEPLQAYVGSSSSIGWFALLKDTGNLATKTSPLGGCSPWPLESSDPSLASGPSYDQLDCHKDLSLSLSSRNISTTSTDRSEARSSDQISYTLSIRNTGDSEHISPIAVNIEDLLEYSQIINRGGGTLLAEASVLGWTDASIGPGETIERSFIVQLLPSIPSTARGSHMTSSYDCTISASFGNTIHTPVDCPLIKRLEKITASLPSTPAKYSLVAAGALLTVTLYLYLRSSQLLRELHIIRHNNLGGL